MSARAAWLNGWGGALARISAPRLVAKNGAARGVFGSVIRNHAENPTLAARPTLSRKGLSPALGAPVASLIPAARLSWALSPVAYSAPIFAVGCWLGLQCTVSSYSARASFSKLTLLGGAGFIVGPMRAGSRSCYRACSRVSHSSCVSRAGDQARGEVRSRASCPGPASG